MEKQTKAYFYACVAVLLWSTIASAFKISLRHEEEVLILLFYASVVACVFLFLYLLFLNKLTLLKAFTRQDYLRSALLGFLNPFLYYTILLEAYSRLKAQEAVTLNFIWPIMLVLLSIPLLHQKIKLKSILAIIISFMGVFVIATEGDVLGFRFTNTVGVLLASGSSVVWALFWIYNVKDKHDEAVRLFVNFGLGTVFILISILLFSKLRIPDHKVLLGAAYIGLCELGITFLVWLKALRLSKTTAQVTNLIYLVPFFALVLISLVVREPILFSTVIGLVLIVGGIILQRFWAKPG
ncbi:MAG: EamA family transporter [Phycisphaerae bacterium]|nr:DMT family transporter [Phycisphaerae bacterium]NIR67191.1 DMT family transporter [candidate division Zixibacteria bacterium]NIP53645.1 DMT family transporter [Phycisphaerae bacterium]NIS51915.1 DMT family transporter [Phycisphaerae bacterium]NIU09426.1 DMT family transporter [Phycisphaerae bacterium]